MTTYYRILSKHGPGFEVHFEEMRVSVQEDHGMVETVVRRLSTNSAAAMSDSLPFMTHWLWHWRNDAGHFVTFHSKVTILISFLSMFTLNVTYVIFTYDTTCVKS